MFVFLVAVVWVGGCAVSRHTKAQRDEIYAEVWKDAPELERQHAGLAAESARLHEFRRDLERRKLLFETEAAKQEADRKIAAVDAQIARLEAQRLAIISSVEQQALTNVSTKVENPMQREMIARLEAETKSIVGDAESLRREIEVGVSGDPLSYAPAPPPSESGRLPAAKTPAPGNASPPERSPKGTAGSRPSAGDAGSRKAARTPGSAARLFEPRVWNDRYGHRVSARLLHVADARGNAVATLGVDPADIAASDWVVHLQRQDGAIIRVPAVKFSSRDLDFLSEGG